jgi:hypothetical protein
LDLRFDYLPARMGETTIQMRDIDAKDAKEKRAPQVVLHTQ